MNQQRIAQLEEQARNVRKLQSVAMNMRNAAQFGRLEKELQNLYRQIDQLRKA